MNKDISYLDYRDQLKNRIKDFDKIDIVVDIFNRGKEYNRIKGGKHHDLLTFEFSTYLNIMFTELQKIKFFDEYLFMDRLLNSHKNNKKLYRVQ